MTKWAKGAKESIVVAGGNGMGEDLTQLSNPRGLWVDDYGHVHVADQANHRLVCWKKGVQGGTLIVDENGRGALANQLSDPHGVCASIILVISMLLTTSTIEFNGSLSWSNDPSSLVCWPNEN